MKKSIVITILFISFLFLPNSIKADSTYIINDKAVNKACTIRTKPNEGGNWLVPGKVHYLDPGDKVEIVDLNDKTSSTNSKCSTDYYHVSYAGNIGYVCGDFIIFETDNTYTNELKDAGFPDSYIVSLNVLKKNHPNWQFKAIKTGLIWNDVLNVEGSVGTNYIYASDPNGADAVYLSLDGGSYDPVTKKYIEQEVGGWYAANKETVAYFMDPRNFLNERDIYMFESNYYNNDYTDDELTDTINNIFKKNSLSNYTKNYIDTKNIGISPVFLAARSRQEVAVGTGVSNAASGKNGYYNFFNIGAYSSCINPVYCGNDFASNKGWTTPENAISGGAYWIYTNYTEKNQQTLYFQKFNVNNAGNTYAHQYMKNIQAPKTEASSMYNGYTEQSKQKQVVFYIPVYENMPDNAVQLPTKVNDEEKDRIDDDSNKEPEKNTLSIAEIVNGAGYQYNSGYITKIDLATTPDTLKNNLQGLSSDAKISVNSNGKEILGTGDTVTITNNDKTETLTIVIYGDVNGDGKINVNDLLAVQKHLLDGPKLSGKYYIAADVNKVDGVTVNDLLDIQRYLLR